MDLVDRTGFLGASRVFLGRLANEAKVDSVRWLSAEMRQAGRFK